MVLVKTKSSLVFIIKSHLLSEFLTYLIKKLLSIRENLKQMLRYLLQIWGDAGEYSACHASMRTRVLSPESGEMSHTLGGVRGDKETSGSRGLLDQTTQLK